MPKFKKFPYIFSFIFSLALLLFLSSTSKVFAMSASGSWKASTIKQAGSIKMSFPPNGGKVSGTFGGGGAGVTFGGRFSGNFTGGWSGRFSGSFNGWWSTADEDGNLTDGTVGGPWSGSLSEGGTIRASFDNTHAGGLDGKANLTYNTVVFERELKPTVDDDVYSDDVDWEDTPRRERSPWLGWISDTLKPTNAYVTINGERKKIGKTFELKQGMVIETEGDGGELIMHTESGFRIHLRGDGAKIKLVENDWSKYEDEGIVVLGEKTMMVQYEVAGKSGFWKKAGSNLRKQEKGDAGQFVAFSDTEDKDMFEWLLPMYVENNSTVEYDYNTEDGEILIKVWEGDIILYRADLNEGEKGDKEEVISAEAGETVRISVADFKAGKDSGMVKGEFDASEKSDAALSLEKYAQVSKMRTIIIIGGIAVVGLAVFVIVKKLTRKK